MPRLSHFIREHHEAILEEWERFAKRLPSTDAMDVEALRDHAGEMLDSIARDLETPQTERQRFEKSQGAPSQASPSEKTAASRHGLGRAESGFSAESMVAEFRALRASVISLWRKEQVQAGPDELEEMTRFNEAIDEAIAESLARYAQAVQTTRTRFFAVLGHDLQTPLAAIITSTRFLLETAPFTDEQRIIVSGIERSGRRMTELVRDLLDLALTGLGSGIPLERADVDMGALARDVVAEAAASNPASRIELQVNGALEGTWDRARLEQALSNLVGNALQYGSPGTPISVLVCGDDPDSVILSVKNEGEPIPSSEVGELFKAMTRRSEAHDRRHLGLGLFIVDRIVDAHGGTIDVQSSAEEGTTFTISLPRRPDQHER